MVATASRVDPRTAEQVAVRVVDCDVHLVAQSKAEILERMPEPWRSRIGKRRANANGKATYSSYEADGRMDSKGPSGLPGGSEPELVYKQLFEEAGVDLAMLVPAGRYRSIRRSTLPGVARTINGLPTPGSTSGTWAGGSSARST